MNVVETINSTTYLDGDIQRRNRKNEQCFKREQRDTTQRKKSDNQMPKMSHKTTVTTLKNRKKDNVDKRRKQRVI